MIPNRFGLQFHHMGLAVRDPTPAIAFLEAVGYRRGNAVFDALQGANLSLCTHPTMPDVELVWPGPGASPIDRIVSRSEAAIYHLCYSAADAAASLAAMEREGIDVIDVSPPTPAILFEGNKVSFHCIAGIGVIEILERVSAAVGTAALVD